MAGLVPTTLEDGLFKLNPIYAENKEDACKSFFGNAQPFKAPWSTLYPSKLIILMLILFYTAVLVLLETGLLRNAAILE